VRGTLHYVRVGERPGELFGFALGERGAWRDPARGERLLREVNQLMREQVAARPVLGGVSRRIEPQSAIGGEAECSARARDRGRVTVYDDARSSSSTTSVEVASSNVSIRP
jgi:hypothetical protein